MRVATQEERIQEFIDDGLTADEAAYLTTPIAKMNPQQRLTGFSIKDKHAKIVQEQNDEWRRKRAEEEALKAAEADGEIEFEEALLPGPETLTAHV